MFANAVPMPSSLSMTQPNSTAGGPSRRVLLWSAAVAVLVIALDQLSKWLLLASGPAPGEAWPLLPALNLVNVCNPGISFGLLSGESAIKPWLLSGLALVVVVGLLIWMRNKEGWVPLLATGLVVGGAIGNVIDRLNFGCVVDFVDLYAGAWHWPAFNLADSAITVGVGLLIVHGLFLDAEESKK